MRKLVLEKYIKLIIESEADQNRPKTFGDLKNALAVYIKAKGKSEKIKKYKEVGKSSLRLALDFTTVQGIPVGVVANCGELLYKLMHQPDRSRPEGFLANFDLDDYTSQIVDNGIETEFLEYLVEKIKSTPNDKPIKDFNMTVELNNYLKQNYGGRHVKK